jgi:hypothetical protein
VALLADAIGDVARSGGAPSSTALSSQLVELLDLPL